MRRASFAVTLLAATLFPAAAFAQDEVPPLPPATGATTPSASATVDAVYLRNGGMYRGRVTEIVPGDHVTVLVQPSNETKRIPWPEVDRVIVASTPAYARCCAASPSADAAAVWSTAGVTATAAPVRTGLTSGV